MISSISDTKLQSVRSGAINVLHELLHHHGIYASSDAEWSGMYHHFFGRDSAITAILIHEAELITGKEMFGDTVTSALAYFARFQGEKDDPINGEEAGKIPHEVNTTNERIKKFQKHLADKNELQWHVNGNGILVNYDSVDSTPLWIIGICRYAPHEIVKSPELKEHLILATKWCLNNLENYGGFAGWMPATIQPGRQFGGLRNHTWKDSGSAYLHEDGRIPIYPLHDAFSNALFWCALNLAAQSLYYFDSDLSDTALKAAKKLQGRFNKQHGGFYVREHGFYAEALDKNFHQLTAPSVDIGMALSAFVGNEAIINTKRLPAVVGRLVGPQFYNQEAGLRTYQKNIEHYDEKDQYHRSPDTYWPFTSALTAMGMDKMGYQEEAVDVLEAMMNGMEHFDSMIEMFVARDGRYDLWRNTKTQQTSAHNQAWTAASAYYATSYLLRQ